MADSIVIDSSAWIAISLSEPGSDILEPKALHNNLLAPELIRYEIANVFLNAHRKGTLYAKDKKGLRNLLEQIPHFPFQTVPAEVWWEESVRLVEMHKLTFYDASYVAIAKRLSLPLMTLDKEILKVMLLENILPA